jgi:hypothetical protein
MQRRVPASFVERLRVSREEEYGVFGYLADSLYAITNVTGNPIRCVLVLGDDDRRPLTLETNERYVIDLDVDPCIKRRVMPYVQTEETIDLDVEWRYRGG